MKLFGILLLALSFGQCASVKMEKNPPFKIESAKYTKPTGDKGNYKTTDLLIKYSANTPVDFQKVYFQNKITNAVVKQKGDEQFIEASFTNQVKKDIILHEDPREEFGNSPTPPQEELPFKLKDNEAVISYTKNGKTHYVKIENVIGKHDVYMQ